jgi:hypothetical protein
MKRRYAVFAVFFAILVLIEIQAVEVVDANPFFMYQTIDPIPGAIPPTITINSPKNNTVYSPDNLAVSFNVSKPQLDTSIANSPTRYYAYITSIYYTLDNDNETRVYYNYKNGVGTKGVPEFNTTLTLPSLSIGSHSITVKAYGIVNPDHLYIFGMESNSTTFFTIETQPITQTSSTNYLLTSTSIFTIVGVVAIVAVASISLVYFKRRKAKTT